MLSQIRCHIDSQKLCQPVLEEKWQRNMQEDMKTALDLLWKFKESLDKLHPDCLYIIEKMISINR